MSNLTLYQLAAEYKDLERTLTESDLDEQTIADTLEAESGDLESKMVAVASVAENHAATAEQVDKAIKQMQARSKALKNKEQRLRDYLLDHMLSTGIEKIQCPHFVIKPAKNPARVDIEDERQVPDKFWVTKETKSIDKTAIKEAIDGGEEVPGAALRQGRRLSIK